MALFNLSPKRWGLILVLTVGLMPIFMCGAIGTITSEANSGSAIKTSSVIKVSKSSAVSETLRPAVIRWRGQRNDHRWSNPANWEGGHVPEATDVVRFGAHTISDALIDADSVGHVAGLVLEQGYRGAVTLERDFTVSGDFVIAGG